jgi:hypothetical protein
MIRTMPTKAAVFAAAVLAASLLALGSPATAGGVRAVPRRGIMLPTVPTAARPAHGGSVNSLNWSGYVDVPPSGSKVTSVTGHWTVPTAGLLPPGFSAMWTGIGGFGSTDLIQAGTTQDTLDGYSAWYEVLPAAETPLTNCTGDAACTVNPGDVITTTITSGGGSQWTITMIDSGHWSSTITLTYASTQSSAEWIFEAPTLLVLQTTVTNVGTATFDPNNSYQVNGGGSQSIGAGNPTEVILSPLGLFAEATPSSLDSDGDGFNDCTYTSTCSPPRS